MSKVTVELEADAVDSIVKQQLISALQGLEHDATNRQLGVGLAVFEHDPDQDIAEIKRHIDALTLILSYYGYSK